MARLAQFRVRVIRCAEGFIDVEAYDPEDAEKAALAMPGVKSVFAKSAIRTDLADEVPLTFGIEGAHND